MIKKIMTILALGIIILGLFFIVWFKRTHFIINEAIEESGWEENIKYTEESITRFDLSRGSFSKVVVYEDEPELKYYYMVMDMGNKEIYSLAYREGSSVSGAKYLIRNERIEKD